MDSEDKSPQNYLAKAWRNPEKVIKKIKSGVQKKVTGPLLSPWRKGQTVMFHIGRSGSTVLTDLLIQNGNFYWDGEIYESIFWRFPHDGIPADLQIPTKPFIEPRLRHAGRKFYGFEVKFFHLRLGNETLADFIEHLNQLEFQDYIILKRKNFLRKIVSSAIAHQGNRQEAYHRTAGSDATLKQIHLDVNQLFIDRKTKPLLSFLEEFEADFAKLDHLLQGKNQLRLTYEDDIAPDPQIGYKRICEFVGIPATPVEVKLGKTNPYRLSDMIVNFSEVEKALEKTPFAWMLYD